MTVIIILAITAVIIYLCYPVINSVLSAPDIYIYNEDAVNKNNYNLIKKIKMNYRNRALINHINIGTILNINGTYKVLTSEILFSQDDNIIRVIIYVKKI